MKNPRDLLKHWVKTVNEEGKKLTDWEKEFMESLTEQFDDSGSMSERQEEILERIYSQRTA